MAATRITVKSNRGSERVFRELENLPKGWRKAIRHMWFGVADDLKNRANAEILRKLKSGRLYITRTRSGRRRRHRASAPGETHANFSGTLRKAISWKVHGNDELAFGYGVTGGSPKYDEFVEFGTRKMEPRPSLDNAITFAQANVELRFTEEMNREFGT